MKKITKLFVLTLLLCLTAACSQTFEDVNYNSKPQEVVQGRLVMKVGDNSRTLNPSINESMIRLATLKVNGKEIKTWTGSETIITDIENDGDILLPVGNCELELAFYSQHNEVFKVGKCNTKITTGDNVVTFNMQIVSPSGGGKNFTVAMVNVDWKDDCNVDEVKAGLYNIETGNVITFSDDDGKTITCEETEKISSNKYYTYMQTGMPAGQYLFKCELYFQGNLVNTLIDVIKVVNGIGTADGIKVGNLNKFYAVTYQTDGIWNDGFVPVTARLGTAALTLPTGDDITHKDSEIMEFMEFIGWYDEDGNKMTEIPAGMVKDIVLTSKWKMTCTGDNLLDTIGRFNFGIYDITVTGNITSNIVSEIKDMCEIKNFKMSLDLSQTTGLTSIDDNAFFYEVSGNSGAGGVATLTDIVLPESVTQIGKDAFYKCPNLKSVTFSNSTENWEIKGCSLGDAGVFIEPADFTDPEQSANFLKNTRYLSVYTYTYAAEVIEATADNVVSKLSNLSSKTRYTVKLSGNITADTISSMKTNLESDTKKIDLDLSQTTGLTTLDKAAFALCRSLITLTLPDTVKDIKAHAFQNCTNLLSLNIPDSVTHIGHAAFKQCYSLKSITIPDSVTSVGDDVLCYYEYNLNGDRTECDNEQARLKLFEDCVTLESVTLPKNLTFYSSHYMFSECKRLSSVTISGETPADGVVILPENTPEIGPYMFWGCSNLKNVTIPHGATRISFCAFDRCSKLENVTILDGVTAIGMDAFRYCTKLKDITIPNSVTHISEFAFANCESLTNIIIPEGVESIGRRVFDDCKNLESITLPASLTTLGREIFYECEKLESVYITDLDAWCNIFYSGNAEDGGPFGITLPDLYLNGELVTHWDVPENWTFVCTALRGIKSLESVTIPSGITFINDTAFRGCSNLTSVTFENTTNSWYGYDDVTNKTAKIDVTDAAQNATNLKSTYKSYQWYIDWGEVNATADNLVDVILSLPKGEHTVKVSGPITADTLKLLNSDNSSSELSYLLQSDKKKINLDLSGTTGLTEIPDYLFSHCEALKSIVIPDGVTSIGEYAFFRSYSLENVILPSSMKTIGSCAFKECTALKSITIPDSVTWFGNYVFYFCKDLESITIPDGVETIYEYTFYYCESLKSVTIPNSVTSIGDSAFSACHKLESLTLSNNITTIGKYAFGSCGMLESLTIPDSVTTLEEAAFLGNYGLKSLTIGNGLTYIPESTFIDRDLEKYKTLETLVTGDGLTSLDNVPINEALKSVTIGKGVSSISGSTFSGCINTTFNVSEDNENYSTDGKIIYNKDKTELISYPSAAGDITILDGVTTIGSYAFNGCSSLRNVTFEDTTSTWYYTENSDYTGGIEIDVTETDTNAYNLRNSYSSYYWYKQ